MLLIIASIIWRVGLFYHFVLRGLKASKSGGAVAH